MCCTSEVAGDFKIRQDPNLAASLREFLGSEEKGKKEKIHFCFHFFFPFFSF